MRRAILENIKVWKDIASFLREKTRNIRNREREIEEERIREKFR